MIPVLEVGGTHVSAALVDPSDWSVSSARRLPLDADAPADELIALFAKAARCVPAPPGATWGVAMPDPFDYPNGIGLFDAAVAKFGSLHGVDVRARLHAALGAEFVFLNDADAFALGEWTTGAGRGAHRLAAITLGTGVGSGWVVDGEVVVPRYPPGGRIHHAIAFDEPLEELMSRRAIRARYVAADGSPDLDVREIVDLARSGDELARETLTLPLRVLGMVVVGCVEQFRPDVLVIGGSMAAGWDVLEEFFAVGAGLPGTDGEPVAMPEIRVSTDADRTGLVGAAVHAAPERRG